MIELLINSYWTVFVTYDITVQIPGEVLGFGSIPVAILPSCCLLRVSYIIIKWMIKGHFHIRKMYGDVGVAQP